MLLLLVFLHRFYHILRSRQTLTDIAFWTLGFLHSLLHCTNLLLQSWKLLHFYEELGILRYETVSALPGVMGGKSLDPCFSFRRSVQFSTFAAISLLLHYFPNFVSIHIFLLNIHLLFLPNINEKIVRMNFWINISTRFNNFSPIFRIDPLNSTLQILQFQLQSLNLLRNLLLGYQHGILRRVIFLGSDWKYQRISPVSNRRWTHLLIFVFSLLQWQFQRQRSYHFLSLSIFNDYLLSRI